MTTTKWKPAFQCGREVVCAANETDPHAVHGEEASVQEAEDNAGPGANSVPPWRPPVSIHRWGTDNV